jgi:hypothetical protein
MWRTYCHQFATQGKFQRRNEWAYGRMLDIFTSGVAWHMYMSQRSMAEANYPIEDKRGKLIGIEG